MRRILLLVFALVIPFYGGAQENRKNATSETYQKIWLGKNYMLYKKALLKVDDKKYFLAFDNSFYFSIEDAINKKNVAYEKKPNTTDVEKLKGRVFLVDTIMILKNYHLGVEFSKPYFLIKDTLTHEELLYKYPVIEDDFPFLCCNVRTEYEKEDLIHNIKKVVDEFEGGISYYSETFQNAVISKIIKNGNESYYLSLKTVGSTLNLNGNGVWIIFDDGTKWHRSASIDVDVKEGSGWYYTCYIKLTDEEVSLLSNKRIKKYRLYIYDDKLDEIFSSKFKLYVQIIKELT